VTEAAVGVPLAAMFDNAGHVVLGVLAVAGGFLVGNILMLLVCRLLTKFVVHTTMNRRFEQALRILAGIAVAILVAWLVFRGGPGWGFGGAGTGEGEGSGGITPSTTHPSEQSPKTTDSKNPPSEVVSPVLRVRIEAATAYPKTFKFEGSNEAVELAAAKKILEDFRAKAKGDPVLEVKVYPDSTAADHPDVHGLITYAHDLRFATRVDKINERVP
jgi:hypothetical protein